MLILNSIYKQISDTTYYKFSNYSLCLFIAKMISIGKDIKKNTYLLKKIGFTTVRYYYNIIDYLNYLNEMYPVGNLIQKIIIF